MNEFLRGFARLAPIAWVLICYDLGADWITVCPLKGFILLFCAAIIAGLLIFLGDITAYGKIQESYEGEEYSTCQLLARIAVLLTVLAVITGIFADMSSRSC